MPIRDFLERFQERRAKVHEAEEAEYNAVPVGGSASSANTQTVAKGFNLGDALGVTNSLTHNKQRSIEGGGSQSTANSNALTNAINLGGIPITNTVSNAHTASSTGAHTGSLGEMFQLGGLGLNVDASNMNHGFGVDRRPGELGFHLGALNLGFSNHGGLLGGFGASQAATQSNAGATATGSGATSSASSQTQSNGVNVGGPLNIGLTNTVSTAQSQATSLNGATSANAGSGAATQTVQAVPSRIDNANPSQQNQYYQRPAGSFLSNPLSPFLGGASLFSNPYQQQYPGQYPQNQYQQPIASPFRPTNNQYPQQYPQYQQQQYPQQYPQQQQYLQQQQYPQQQQQYPNRYQQQYPNQQYPNQFGRPQRPHRPPHTNNQFDNPLGPMFNDYRPPGAYTPEQFNALQNAGIIQGPSQSTGDRNSNSGLSNGNNNGLGSGFEEVLKNPAPVTAAPPANAPVLGSEFQNILNGANPSPATTTTTTTTTAKPYVDNVDLDAPGAEYGLDTRIDEDEKEKEKENENKTRRRRQSPGFGWPFQAGQQNAGAAGQGFNQNPFGQQQTGANTNTQNAFNPFGSNFHNNAGSLGSNLGTDGSGEFNQTKIE